MANPPKIGNPAVDPQLARYYERIDALTGQALAGKVDERTFRQEMERLTLAAILLVFLLAGGDQNTPAAQRELGEQQRIARRSVATLADDIYGGRYSAEEGKQTKEEGREKLQNRLVLWGVTMAGVYAAGQLNAPAQLQTILAPDGREVAAPTELRLVWRLGNTEEHCTDCATLDGQAMTVSEWRAAGIRPQHPDLACGGWRCDCRLEEA